MNVNKVASQNRTKLHYFFQQQQQQQQQQGHRKDLKEFVSPAVPPVGAQRVPVLSSIKAKLSPVLPMKPQMVVASHPTTANGFSATKDTNLRSNDGIETIRVTDMTSSALFPKSFGNIFNTINKSVSTAFSNLISTGDPAGPAPDPGLASHGSQLAPGTQPFLGGGDSGGGLLARFQSLSPIASRRNIPTCTGVPMTGATTRPPGPVLVASSSSAACSLTPQVPQVRSYPPSPLPQPWTPPARPQVNSTLAIGVTETGAFQSVADRSLQPQSIPTGESIEVNELFTRI